MDDRQLVQALLDKNEAAQDLFFKRYRDPLYRAAAYFLGYQDADAEDVVQETFITGLKELGKFQFKSSLGTWLNRICVNYCLKRLRIRNRVLLNLDEELATKVQANRKDQDPLHQVIDKEQREILAKGIESLKEACRRILRLRDIDGLSYAAIGKNLKLPGGTVMSRLARCRKQLLARLKDLGVKR